MVGGPITAPLRMLLASIYVRRAGGKALSKLTSETDAPGLTQLLPFRMVVAVLADARCVKDPRIAMRELFDDSR